MGERPVRIREVAGSNPATSTILIRTFREVTDVKDLLCDGFQDCVRHYLIRHKSIVDIMSKLQESSSRVNRAVAKAVTSCGCIEIHAGRQRIPPGVETLEGLRDHMSTHVEGELCDHCREVLEEEIGRTLFYLAALCNALDLNLYDVLLKEQERLSCLGVFNFS